MFSFLPIYSDLKTRVASQTADLLGTVGKRVSFTTYVFSILKTFASII